MSVVPDPTPVPGQTGPVFVHGPRPADSESSFVDLPVSLGNVVADRYRVEGILAEGGMGIVCLGRHVELGQSVAIKFLRRELAENENVVARFLNEARAAAELRSEHIVRVIDVGLIDDRIPYLVMEHLVGIDLDSLLERDGPLAVDRAVEYVRQACLGLAEAHRSGVVHRDIKPENLFLTRDGERRDIVKVVDFGIAKRLDATKTKVLTGPHDQMGSPCYMSPEQVAAPGLVTTRTDIWSLGIVLYRLITGTTPFDGETVVEVCAQVLHAPVPPVNQMRRDVDPRLDTILQRCLRKEPGDRYASAYALAEDLNRFLLRTLPLDGRGEPTTGDRWNLEWMDRPTELDLPLSGPRPRTLLAFLVLAGMTAMGLYQADRRGFIHIRSYTDGWLTPASLSLTMPSPSELSWHDDRPYVVGPAGAFSKDGSPADHLAAERQRGAGASLGLLEVSAPQNAEEIERRKRRYRAFLLRKGWRPLSEVISGNSHGL